jgi:hypothetical protein
MADLKLEIRQVVDQSIDAEYYSVSTVNNPIGPDNLIMGVSALFAAVRGMQVQTTFAPRGAVPRSDCARFDHGFRVVRGN